MLNSLKKYIENNHLCSVNQPLLVAVSGGVDSVVLLHLLAEAGYKIAIAHCNFKLRGTESDKDEAFVKELGQKYKISVYIKHCPAADYAHKHKLTIQEAARNLRYDFFEELSKQKHFHKVAIAHHADDNLETFFINLFRGSGLQGLKGIPVQRGLYIRPLMFATRRQIEQYAQAGNLTWRDDSSNKSLKYLRNKIRHRLLPEIKKITGNFTALFQSMDNLKEDALVLNTLLKLEKSKYVEIKNKQISIRPHKTPSGLPDKLWFYYLLKEYGFSRTETGKIFDAFKNKLTGKHFFSENFELLIDRNSLLIREKKTTTTQKYYININDVFISEPFKANIKTVSGNTVNPTLIKNTRYGFFDYDKLKFPLVLRKWEEGDRFYPYGLKGSKLISDFFTDLKLSLFEKEKVWLLESEGTIVWVAGYRIAEPFKVTGNTKKIFSITPAGQV